MAFWLRSCRAGFLMTDALYVLGWRSTCWGANSLERSFSIGNFGEIGKRRRVTRGDDLLKSGLDWSGSLTHPELGLCRSPRRAHRQAGFWSTERVRCSTAISKA
jgi:hypothetical protein